MRARSGYAVKVTVDRTTKFFWGASYGQIYPELQRLEDAGLVSGDESATGGRRRRVFQLTDVGHQELLRWLREDRATVELRDESLLRIFFADALPPDEAVELLAARRSGHERYLEQLRELKETAADDPPFVQLALRWGIDFNEWGSRWCTEQISRLSDQSTA